MSSQLQVTGEAKIRDIQGPVVANSGVITALDGAASQYVRGDGTLADFPTSSGGGSSVSYYLNSSVSQGTIGGVAYRELSKEPIIGAGTDIAISTTGYVASYITDANDPDVILIPGGNFNCEFYFSVNNNTGNPFTYAELYKYDGTTFTLLGTSVGVPEYITQGTTIAPYYFAIPVATAALALTDRLAIRIYVNVDGRTVTLHTENGHLCQVVTTLSKGMVSLNNLTDQSQFITTGTSGTNFAIVSSGDTHTFNLPVASAINTGKLSSTDWSTFNNKQNTITDPITGTGNSTQIAYFNSPTSITSEAAFNYDASTNRLGVNTSVPNATIGANAGTDSGYSLLLKNDNSNYNGIGFGTDSTYGNLISTEKLGTALARNLTLLNQSGYISLTEAGNLGVGILSPNTGVDIYNGTSAYLWLHTANSGITGTDGVRLALFSTNGANLRNFDGSFSITAEGDFSIITIGAENFRVNSADGSIYQSKVANAMLKSVSGVITAAVANTDYQSPIALTTSGSSGAATFSSNTLNVPNYTLSGLGGVPTSRTLSINGVSYDLSADRSWTITSDITGSGADGRVAYWNGTNSITSEAGFIYDASTNRLGVNTSVPNATIGADAALNSGYGLLIKTGASNYNGIGIAIDSTYGNTIETAKLGTASARNLTLLNQSGFVSLTESGAFGVGILTPNNGIDIYNSTQSQLWLHNNASGLTATDGVRLALFNNLSANLRNFDGGLSLTAEGDFQIITIGAENLRVNSANGFIGIGNPASLPSMLTVNGGATITGLTTGQVLFPTSGGTLSGTNSLFWDNATDSLRIGSNTSANRRLSIFSSSDANHFALISNAPAITLSNNFSYTYYATVGMATASNNFVAGTVAGDLVLGAFNTNSIIFSNANTNTQRMKLTSGGDLVIGATSADTKLDVRGEISLSYSASNGLRFYNQDRSNWSSIGNDTATGTSNANLVFRTSAGTALTIAANRNTTFATTAIFSSNVLVNATSSTYGAASGYNLGVKGTSGQAFISIARTGQNLDSQGIIFGLDTASAQLTMIDNLPLTFGTNNTTRMTITSSGVVELNAADATYIRFSYLGTSKAFVGVAGATSDVISGAAAGDTVIRAQQKMLFSTGGDTERMRITGGGDVLVGTTSSAGKLSVSGNAGAYACALQGSTTSGQSYGLIINGGSTSGDYSFYVRNAAQGSPYIYVRGDGYLYSASAWSGSDRRLKENISDLDNGLNKVLGLKARKFDFIDGFKNQYGFIAQELQEIIPDAVSVFDEKEEMLAVKMDFIIPHLVKAIQEQQEQIEELKKIINNK